MHSIKRSVKHGIKSRLIMNRMKKANIDIRDTIILFSDPRSGSTWLMNMLQQIPNTATIFEPEHWEHGLLPSSLKFGAELQYIPKDHQWTEAKKAFEKIFLGYKLNKWTEQHSAYHEWMQSEQIIVKFVRGNTFIPWLINQFDFKYKPVYLLRHPLAVANSRLRNFKEDQAFQSFNFPDQPFNENILVHKPFLESLKTSIEIVIAIWCLNNKALLQEEDPKEYIKVNYENLRLQPEVQLRKIFNQLTIPLPKKALEMINKPSVTDFNKEMVADPHHQIEKWVKLISPEQQAEAQRVLDYFEIREYSAYNAYPNDHLPQAEAK